MTAARLLARLRELGAVVEPAGDNLRVRGAEQVPEPLRLAAKASKAEILAALRLEPIIALVALYERLAAPFRPDAWLALVDRLQPGGRWLPELVEADRRLDAAVGRYLGGENDRAGLDAAIRTYEGAWHDAIANVARQKNAAESAPVFLADIDDATQWRETA